MKRKIVFTLTTLAVGLALYAQQAPLAPVVTGGFLPGTGSPLLVLTNTSSAGVVSSTVNDVQLANIANALTGKLGVTIATHIAGQPCNSSDTWCVTVSDSMFTGTSDQVAQGSILGSWITSQIMARQAGAVTFGVTQ